MANWTDRDIVNQLNRAKTNGWISSFGASAERHRFDIDFLLAIASRETNMRDIKGDFHDGAFHGFGIMQVDIGTDPVFCAQWTPNQVESSIEHGTKILAAQRDALAAKNIGDLKAVAAAYNAGPSRVIHLVQAGSDPDSVTTGHNYGADVVARRDVFLRLRSVGE